MPVCASCGTENREGARFCDSCAAPLEAPAGERRKLATLLFCDVSGSTAMGERLDAESVRALMFRYFHEMRSAIERHGGTVEKFVGDAVLAVFGVPVAHEDDALRAVRAAAEMRDRIAELNEELEARFDSRLALRIGVNTGEVVAGDATSRETFVTGDAVNVAARLEQAARAGEILLGKLTYQLVQDRFEIESVEPIQAKGKTEPVPAYRLRAAVRRASPPSGETSLVGREAELAQLEALFARAEQGGTCVLGTVIGEPGVGKSRLCAELVSHLGHRASAYTSRCLSYGEGITYWPLAEIVKQAASIRDEHSVEQARDRLSNLVEQAVAIRIGALIGLGGEVSVDEASWVVRVLFEALAAERPVVALVEDIHWAEPTFLDLLQRVSKRARAPILVLCTARPELTETRPEWPVTIALEPLSEGEVEQLLEPYALEQEAQLRVVASARGNPLFAEELGAFLREQPDEGQIPATLGALLTARLDLLPEGERAAAERGAVEGELFHRGAVAALSGRDVGDELAGLVRRELLRPAEASFLDEAAFRFKHILVRDAAYSGTAKKLRAELHELFADWLEGKAADRVGEFEEILGYHLEQAYRYRTELGPADEAARLLAVRAASLLGAAGTRAEERDDMYATRNLLDRALTLLPATAPERPQLLYSLGRACHNLSDLERAERLYAEALALAQRFGDRNLEWRARLRRASVRRDRRLPGASELLRSEAQKALAESSQLDSGTTVALGWWLLAAAALDVGDASTALDAARRAYASASASGNPHLAANGAAWMAVAMAFGPTPASELLDQAEELVAATSSSHFCTGIVLVSLAYCQAISGDFDQARLTSAEARQLANEYGLGGLLLDLTKGDGEIERLAGDLAAAEQHLRTASELQRAWSSTPSLDLAAAFGRVTLAQGRLAETLDLTSLDETEARDRPSELAAWQSIRALALARSGDLQQADRLSAEAVTLVAADLLDLRAQTLADRADVLLRAGRQSEGTEALKEALATYERKGNLVMAERTREQLTQLATPAQRRRRTR